MARALRIFAAVLVVAWIPGCGLTRAMGPGRLPSDLDAVDVEEARASGDGAAPIGGATWPEDEDLLDWAERPRLEALGDELDAALEVEPDSGDLHVLRSHVARLVGDVGAALEHARRGVELLPRNSRARYAEALAYRAQLVDVGRGGRWTAVLGSLGVVGDYKDALAAAIELDPTFVAAREEELAVLLFAPWPVGAKGRALERLEELEVLDSARAQLFRAQRFAVDGQGEEAFAALDAVDDAQLDAPGRAAKAFALGQVLQEARRWRDAAAVYEPLAEPPRTARAWDAAYQLLRVREKGRFELDEAVALAHEFLDQDPAGDFLPTRAKVEYRLGLCLEHLGRVDEARAAYERSIALDRNERGAQKALRRVGD